jgi:hypothetical protein
MASMQRDDHWIRHGLAILEMSAGALSVTPVPSRRAFHAFAALARGLAERAPGWLSPWPILEVVIPARDERPLAAVSLERSGHRLIVAERAPAPGELSVTVVLEYYLHLVHDHLRACRLAARRPAGLMGRLPGDEAELAEAFEEVERILHGTAGVERLASLWETLAASA